MGTDKRAGTSHFPFEIDGVRKTYAAQGRGGPKEALKGVDGRPADGGLAFTCRRFATSVAAILRAVAEAGIAIRDVATA
jgi:hypothetical protein